jgi:membrane associated rhomboid family serine protease
MDNFKFDGLPASYVLNRWFALNPIGGHDVIGNSYNFQVWQLITYQFMHGGFSHIFFNMFGLWMFGMEVENTWGSRKFLYFYLLCGVVAGLFQLFITPLLGSGLAPTIGASGAVYGVLLAFAMMFPDRYIFLYFFIPIKAKYLIGFLIIMEFMVVNSANDSVAHLAHLGGAFAAFIFILLDKNTNVVFKNMFRRNAFKTSKPFNPFGGTNNPFKKRSSDVQDANYYDVKDSNDDSVNQQEIDEILDKISKSGYQNLTEREKRILFQASKKMK